MSQTYRALLVKQTNAEFNGNSFTGLNLIKTLETIDFSALTSTKAYETYSVVAIVPYIILRQITA